jgi:hypothetical protein
MYIEDVAGDSLMMCTDVLGQRNKQLEKGKKLTHAWLPTYKGWRRTYGHSFFFYHFPFFLLFSYVFSVIYLRFKFYIQIGRVFFMHKQIKLQHDNASVLFIY